MGRVAPRANLHSARLSWVAADIRPIRDSRRRLAASTNKERRKSLRTPQGQFRLPRLSGNHHRVRCSAQMDSRANTCVAPSSTNSLVALDGKQVHLPTTAYQLEIGGQIRNVAGIMRAGRHGRVFPKRRPLCARRQHVSRQHVSLTAWFRRQTSRLPSSTQYRRGRGPSSGNSPMTRQS
jgi:hypothetical protein